MFKFSKKISLIKSKFFNIILAVLICLSGFLYLAQINNVAAKGYEIRDLEDRLEGLKEDNKKMELKVTELQSMKRVQEKMSKLNLVSAVNIDYLSLLDARVAIK